MSAATRNPRREIGDVSDELASLAEDIRSLAAKFITELTTQARDELFHHASSLDDMAWELEELSEDEDALVSAGGAT